MTGNLPIRPRRPRPLSEDDRAVWRAIARQVKALPSKRPKPTGEADSAPAVPSPSPAFVPSVAAPDGSLLGTTAYARASSGEHPGGSITFDLHDSAPLPVGRPEAGLDRRTADRLRKGDRVPDARIDLHGMTVERAHPALMRFVADALARNFRCVLVITGKGGRSELGDDAPFMRRDRGVLRQHAPRWLLAGPHARQIVGIYAAHRRHGGEGAFYVYLKKSR